MKVVLRHETSAIVNVDGREFIFFSFDCLHTIERNSDGKAKCGEKYEGEDKEAIIEAIRRVIWSAEK